MSDETEPYFEFRELIRELHRDATTRGLEMMLLMVMGEFIQQLPIEQRDMIADGRYQAIEQRTRAARKLRLIGGRATKT